MSWCPSMCKLWPKPYPRNADDITKTVTPFPHPAHRTGRPNGEGDGASDNSMGHNRNQFVHYFRFASGLAISRALSTKNRAEGLSARFFRLATPTGLTVGGSIGGSLMVEGQSEGEREHKPAAQPQPNPFGDHPRR